MPSSDKRPSPHFVGSALHPVLLYGIFTLAGAGLIYWIWAQAMKHGSLFFMEDSALEWLQFGTMLTAFLVFQTSAWSQKSTRQISVALSVLPALAAIREQDALLDRLLPGLGWQFPFFLSLAFLAVHCWRHRLVLLPQIRTLLNHRSFSLMWAGFIVAIPFAQLIGHGPLMEQMFGEEHQKAIKRMFEESMEAIGYFIILIGSLDWHWSATKKAEP